MPRAFLSLLGGFAALLVAMSGHLRLAYALQTLGGVEGASVLEGAGLDVVTRGLVVALAGIAVAFSIWYQRTGERKWAMINRVGRLVGIAAVLVSLVPTSWLMGR